MHQTVFSSKQGVFKFLHRSVRNSRTPRKIKCYMIETPPHHQITVVDWLLFCCSQDNTKNTLLVQKQIKNTIKLWGKTFLNLRKKLKVNTKHLKTTFRKRTRAQKLEKNPRTVGKKLGNVLWCLSFLFLDCSGHFSFLTPQKTVVVTAGCEKYLIYLTNSAGLLSSESTFTTKSVCHFVSFATAPVLRLNVIIRPHKHCKKVCKV